MSSSEWVQLWPLAAILVLMYVLMIRPARRRQREVAALQKALSPGDEIMLTSGVFGHVVSVDGETANVEVAAGVVLKVHRGAVGKMITDVAGNDSEALDSDADSTDDPDEADVTDRPDASDHDRGAR